MYYIDSKRQSEKSRFLAYVDHSEAVGRAVVNYVIFFFP